MSTTGAPQLAARLGYRFRDPRLLEQALTHRSYVNENPGEGAENNERLEFLGDAVLDFVVSDMLMRAYPALPEGQLSKMRASLVSEPALAAMAQELTLGEHLRMGRGEELSSGREKTSILSDAFEAVIAAVYLDSAGSAGVDAVRGVIERLFRAAVQQAEQRQELSDFKTALQELVQRHYKDTVRYRVVLEEGPDHDKRFEVAVLFRDREYGRGAGRSKKQAEQAAAQSALARFQETLRHAEGT